MQRRDFLQKGLGFGAGLTLGPVMAAAPSAQGLVCEVRDDAAAPWLHRGEWLVVDVGQAQWQGAGLYLYPDWGRPRAWQIEQRAGQLVFFLPGQAVPAWTQTVADTRLAGRVVGVLPAGALGDKSLSHAQWQPLSLPPLPQRRRSYWASFASAPLRRAPSLG